MTRARAYPALALLCALPRLAVVLHERAAITASYTEKSDTFAQTFVAHGTYGFLPGEPSAYTQPLYGWCLVPVYWLFGRNWASIGIAQIVLAVATAWLVFEIGRRLAGARVGAVAAAVATLNPYLVWHDVHVNREIADQVCAAALVLLTLAVAERPSRRLAALLGVVGGLAMLGNTRLVFLPLVCVAYLLWRLPRSRGALTASVLVLACAGVTVAPWLVRNKVDVGCWAITTDGRALWKANNSQTYGLLESGHWIDNVSTDSARPPAPNRLTPEEAWGYLEKGRSDYAYRLYPDECAQMTFYEHEASAWVRKHPGAKARLGLLSLQLLWQPTVIETGRNESGASHGVARRLAEPAYMIALYLLAVLGAILLRGPFVVLTAALLAYQSLCAIAFVGATRYRIAWDFLVALLAVAGAERAFASLLRRRDGTAPLESA
ncbi:MAG TPA: glycosyltransferase family 39 protein [Gaiellaceae bacterium]|nr:glycosyltransferase family 39 protein [Gaiellaceae bacterium]